MPEAGAASSSCSSPSADELRDAGLAVGTGDVLTYCAAARRPRPERPGRPLLGRTRRRWSPAATRSRSTTGSSGGSSSTSATRRPTPSRCSRRIRAAAPAQSVLEIPATEPGGAARRGGGQPRADGLRHRGPAGQVVRRLHARGAGRAAPHHGADPPDAASPAHPADGTGAPRHAGPTCGGRSGRPCARTASRPSCSGVVAVSACGRSSSSSTSPARCRTTRATCCSSRTPTSRAAARVEVFCFGTRLTRITKALERRRPDDALDQAAKAVVDWEGGTRIGDSLDAFVRGMGSAGHQPGRHRRHLLRRPGPW